MPSFVVVRYFLASNWPYLVYLSEASPRVGSTNRSVPEECHDDFPPDRLKGRMSFNFWTCALWSLVYSWFTISGRAHSAGFRKVFISRSGTH